MAKPDNSDFVVLVMGVSGQGKSDFINLLAPGCVKVGSSQYSETQDCHIVKLELGTRSVYLIDTPGFNDTKRSDAKILNKIMEILTLQYYSGIPLRGILFLRKIGTGRMFGTDVTYMRMFRDMCGPEAFSNLILLTTFWDQIDQKEGARARAELREFWSEMIDGGLEIRQFDRSLPMAQRLIERFSEMPDIVLQIQKEVVQGGLMIEETAAGKWLTRELQGSLAGEVRQIQIIEEEITQASRANSGTEQRQLESRLGAAKKKRDDIAGDQQLMKRQVGNEISAKVEREKRTKKWKDAISIVASILGVGITLAVQLILPLAGVSM